MSEIPATLASLPAATVAAQLHSGQLRYRVGPFQLTLRARIPALAGLLQQLYGECKLADKESISDFTVSLRRPLGPRRWFHPQVLFVADDEIPFSPLPLDSAFPLLEWGFNWCVATTAHQYLLLHCAVLERSGKALLMPAFPGSGKSTLTAALAYRGGWRLLSDEFGLIRPGTRQCVSFPRCIPLKNESIEVFKRMAPEAVIGPVFPKTRKGDVAHVKPPPTSNARDGQDAPAAHVVFPRFESGAACELRPLQPARAFMKLCTNAFNYDLLGESGFETVATIIENSDCYLLRFGHLHEAVQQLDQL